VSVQSIFYYDKYEVTFCIASGFLFFFLQNHLAFGPKNDANNPLF